MDNVLQKINKEKELIQKISEMQSELANTRQEIEDWIFDRFIYSGFDVKKISLTQPDNARISTKPVINRTVYYPVVRTPKDFKKRSNRYSCMIEYDDYAGDEFIVNSYKLTNKDGICIHVESNAIIHQILKFVGNKEIRLKDNNYRITTVHYRIDINGLIYSFYRQFDYEDYLMAKLDRSIITTE